MNIFQEIYAAVLPTLLELIAAAVGLVLLYVSTIAKNRWGIEIEARHREALHSALMTGIQLALSRGLRPDAAIASAVEYASRSVPDAIRALKPSDDVLDEIAESKMRLARLAEPIFLSPELVPDGAEVAG